MGVNKLDLVPSSVTTSIARFRYYGANRLPRVVEHTNPTYMAIGIVRSGETFDANVRPGTVLRQPVHRARDGTGLVSNPQEGVFAPEHLSKEWSANGLVSHVSLSGTYPLCTVNLNPAEQAETCLAGKRKPNVCERDSL